MKDRPPGGKPLAAEASPPAGPADVKPLEVQERFLESEAQFRVMAEMLPDIISTTRADGATDFLNQRFYECTGLQPGTAMGFDWKPLIHPDDLSGVMSEWSRCVETGQPSEIRYRLKTANGTYRWFTGRSSPLHNAAGEIIKWVACCTDIDDLKNAQEALEQSRAHLRHVLDLAPIILWAIDDRGIVTLSEGKGLTAIGLKPGGTVGMSAYDVYPDNPVVRDTLRRVLAGDTITLTIQVGSQTLESHSFPLYDDQGKIMGATGVTTDVTELKRSEQSLRKAHDELDVRVRQRTAELHDTVEKLRSEERILRNLLKFHERERQLLAYDIHDGLTQDVVGAKMIVETIRSQLGPDSEEFRGLLNKASGILGRAIDESRRMISHLRPMVIDERGIVEALQYLVGQELSRGELHVHFHHDVQFDRLPSLLEGSLFRIVQEALSNVRRHSRVRAAEVRLVQTGQQLVLEISDQGAGFDPASAPDDRFGLEGIRKRAELFNGHARIESAPGAGTRVTVTLPMPAAVEDDNPLQFQPQGQTT